MCRFFFYSCLLYTSSKGMEQGESRVNRLVQMLIANSRTDEIERAVSDKVYQNKLFMEFKL